MSSRIFTNQLKKYVRSLHARKFRQKYDKFIAEGPKVSTEFLIQGKYPIECVLCTQEWYDLTYKDLNLKLDDNKLCIVTNKQLDQVSAFKTCNQVLIVADQLSLANQVDLEDWSLYLERIQDPGNMGAILRIADWYNISSVMATPDSVDFYNPKVIQAAMGAHNRVNCYTIEVEALQRIEASKYAMALDGADVENMTKPNPGIIIIGNESKGISMELLKISDSRWTIPKLGGAESLNAAVACGIICHKVKATKY